jgi:Rieske 2Fe-2S family protein
MTLLTETKQTLPSVWYYDPEQYTRELQAIWYRDWVCVGRLDDIAAPGDFRVVSVGAQNLIVTRNENDEVRVFHNTCRHRGSTLCAGDKGRFPNRRIICPYHTWTYSLDGDLLATPARVEVGDFCAGDFSLYSVHSDTWGGFIFVNLSDAPAMTLLEFLGDEAEELASWPLTEMVSVHQETSVLNCNWKVFWENYSECYHCPRLHPELCKVVPVYKKAILSNADDPEWQADSDHDDGRPRVGKGMKTWTMDGQTSLPAIDGLTDEEREIGMHFASFTASLYVVGHTDYVRSVRLVPTGPESLILVVDWLLMPGVAESHQSEVEQMMKLGRLVVEQDGRICELNQQGLKSPRHEHGVLVPQEESLWEFHEWLRAKLDAHEQGKS